MSIYQELQLNQAGSKALIRNSKDSREKRRHLLIYVFKVFLTLAFCMAFVTAYTKIFGEDNSVAGVVVLLTVMVFRSADLGIKASHGMGVIVILFAVLAVGPRLTHMVPAGWAFLLDFVFLLLLLTLGCHNIIMANHATWVLGYLLLQGNDVSGHAYFMRVLALALGALLTALVFYRNHREITYKRGLRDLLGEFALSSARTKWQLRMALGISSGMFFAQLLHLPRVMWAGFAMMSISSLSGRICSIGSNTVFREMPLGVFCFSGCARCCRRAFTVVSVCWAALVWDSRQPICGRQCSTPSGPLPWLRECSA